MSEAQANKERAQAQVSHLPEELHASLREKLEALRKLRFKHALGQLKETHHLGQARREIAQIQTALTRHAQAAQEST